MSKLPTDLPSLIEHSVECARKTAKRKGYKLDMQLWHTPIGRVTHVCMAGAVMARTLKVPKGKWLDVYDTYHANALQAINAVRIGDIQHAMYCMDWYTKPKVASEVALMIDDKFNHRLGRAPWSVYLKAAGMLRKAGVR